ncbi:MAG: glycosyltransferase family 4 protein [Archangium sp.]|nr:glycosyltransferase family 4 protein [Archangium sp.]
MRVAFVNLQLSDELSGVTRAISGQARACREAGVPIDFWVVNPSKEGREDNLHFARFEQSRLGERATRLFKARLLQRVAGLESYDVLLLRYPLAIDLDPLALIRSSRAKVITVHHTREVDELLSGGRTAGALVRAGVERVNGARVLRRVAGIAAVTDEIRRYELARAGVAKPSRTVANGIDVERVPHTSFVPFDGSELRLLFIASSHAPWHGTDRLLASLRAYRGPVKLLLHLVGGASGSAPGTTEKDGALTIQHHGTLHGARLDAVFRDTTLAFSSLAMFRTGLREACVLKTREYMARGVPFVYGYDDVDLPGQHPFCRNVGNSDAPFTVDSLIDFAMEASSHPGLSEAMREFARARMDWKVKMQAFLEFASEVA